MTESVAVKDIALNRRTTYSASKVIDIVDVEAQERPRKALSHSYGETQQTLSEIIDALESGKRKKSIASQDFGNQEKKLYVSWKDELRWRKNLARQNCKLVLRCIDLEEKCAQKDEIQAKKSSKG